MPGLLALVVRENRFLMKLYYMLIDSDRFHQSLTPALGASWRRRSFQPCQTLCAELLPASKAFAERYHVDFEGSLIGQIKGDFPFDRNIWRALVGEVLLYSAAEAPELPNVFASLRCLLTGKTEAESDRQAFTPIDQIELGSRDLIFGGGFYRPDQAGLNDRQDVARLSEYLNSINLESSSASALEAAPEMTSEEEREGELEFIRQEFPNLRQIYDRALGNRQVIACEKL
jgi:hypothetical protein